MGRGHMQEKKLLRVLAGEYAEPPPVWLMRQAGRYLPEYREIRRRAGSFLDLCYTPELAEEVTLQPIRRYGFDAAILFADILLVPQSLGLRLWFVEGEGPRLSPVAGRGDLGRMRPVDEIDGTLSPIYETVRRLRKSLPAETALIGFAGAPWTVATYMVAGRGTPDQGPARRFAYSDPDGFQKLIDRVSEATVHYLSRQIEAGAEAVKIFDSWAGALPPGEFRRWVLEPTTRIVTTLRARHPGVPIIGFPRGSGLGSVEYATTTGVECLAVDTAMPMPALRPLISPNTALQGNLDPLLMVLGGNALTATARALVDQMRGTPFVFNLGHGITPDADPAHVDLLLRAVRE